MINYVCKSFDDLTNSELYGIMVLRQAVFIVEQNCPYLDTDGKDDLAYHIIGYGDHNVIQSYARIFDKGIMYPEYVSIGRVATSSAIRGSGEGRRLMEVCLEKCKTLFGAKSIKIAAQCYILHFYESLGFKAVGESYLEDGIPHQAMILDPDIHVEK